MARTILCVEDEEDTGNLIQVMLEREGYAVTRARDGRQAVLLIETTLPPALILLDVVVPYVNGFELLEALRHNPDWCHVPILILSANHYEPDIQRTLSAGARAYVVKKPGLQGLIEEVTRILPAPAPPAPAPDQNTVMAAPMAPRKRRVSIRHQARDSTRKNRAA